MPFGIVVILNCVAAVGQRLNTLVLIIFEQVGCCAVVSEFGGLPEPVVATELHALTAWQGNACQGPWWLIMLTRFSVACITLAVIFEDHDIFYIGTWSIKAGDLAVDVLNSGGAFDRGEPHRDWQPG